jgi:hypothetical protein
MSALDEVAALIERMSSRKEELTRFEGLLSEISVALGDILGCMEKPEKEPEKGDLAIAEAITTGLRNLPAPVVNVTVQERETEPPPKAWRLKIVALDGNGKAREILFTPEN